MNGMLNQEREAGIGNGREPIKKCLYSVVLQIWPVESALRYDLWAPMSQLWANYGPIMNQFSVESSSISLTFGRFTPFYHPPGGLP